MAITLAQAEEQLAAWIAASLAVAKGKEHAIGHRRLRLEDGQEIREQIAFWEGKVRALQAQSAGVSGTGYAVARFIDD